MNQNENDNVAPLAVPNPQAQAEPVVNVPADGAGVPPAGGPGAPAVAPGAQAGAPAAPAAVPGAQAGAPAAPAAVPIPGGNIGFTPDQFVAFMDLMRNNQQPPPQRARAKLKHHTSILPSDWRDFRIRADNSRVQNEWNDQSAKRMVKAALTEAAGRRTRTVEVGGDPDAVPVPDDVKTYEEFMNELQGRFQHQSASALAIHEFNRASMRSDEDYLSWHNRLQDNFILAYPDRDSQTDRDLIRQYILGLQERVIADHLMDREPVNYQQCLELSEQKQGKLLQVRQHMRARPGGGGKSSSTINAIRSGGEYGFENYLDDDRVAAINYQMGSNTPSTRSANAALRRYGPGMQRRCMHEDHDPIDCPEVNAMRRRGFGKGKPPKGPKKRQNQGGRGRAAGRGRRGNGRGRKAKGGKPNYRRSGANALGEDEEDEALAAFADLTMGDCMEHMTSGYHEEN